MFQTIEQHLVNKVIIENDTCIIWYLLNDRYGTRRRSTTIGIDL